jgi:hypothetical protein
MPVYQVHRLKEAPRQQFRWAPHTSGVSVVKPKDYDRVSQKEASSPYALWIATRETEEALQPGDLLELAETGELRIFKYIGFEEARWYTPEAAPSPPAAAPMEVT